MADFRSDRPRRVRPLRAGLTAVLLAVAGAATANAKAAAPNPGAAGPVPQASLAAASPADSVVDVRIAGNKSVPLEKILPNIRTRPGRAFDLDLIAEDVRRLDHTRLFVNVKTYYQQVPGGRVVIFDVIERPLLREVKFVGCHDVSKKTLQKEAKVNVGDPADPFAIEEARRALESLYHKRGFSAARVTLLEGDKPEDRRAIFLINEGTKLRVWSVKFVGNTIDSDSRLQTQIKTNHPFLWLFKGELDRKELDQDVERLTAWYKGLGFFRVRIGREIETNEKGNWATVTFVVDEGPRCKIRNISVIGNHKFTSDELMAELQLTGEEYFNQAKMLRDVSTLQDRYGGIGYVFADVKPDPRLTEDAQQCDLVYNIAEGDRYTVGKINIQIKGEYPHTQITTILNRLSIHPGDIVDIREIRDSERRLRASRLFEANPATGSVPKIVFNPPTLDGPDEETIAERPRTRPKLSPGRGGMGDGMGRGFGPTGGDDVTSFRGQSPESDSQDRELDVTLDCGRYVGPKDGGEQQDANGKQVLRFTVENPKSHVSNPESRISDFRPRTVDSSSDDLFLMAGDLARTAAHSRNGLQSPSRLIPTQQREPVSRPGVQYMAPDDNYDGRQPLPQNSAPGDRHRRAAQSLDRARLVLTQQRVPAEGMASSSGNAPLRWTSADGASQPAPTYVADSGGTLPPTQPAPAEAAPPVGQQIWPRSGGGPEQTLDSPAGPYTPSSIYGENSPFRGGPPDGEPLGRPLPFGITAEETMTGRLMFGVGVNSDAGLVGSVVLDEQNFDWRKIPTSWEDIRNATAWRGAGQRFRLEAVPGTQVQRYMATFEDPYLFDTQVSMGLSGYYYSRIFNEWTEQRIGGRVALGYQFSPDLSGSLAYRGANVNLTNPIDPNVWTGDYDNGVPVTLGSLCGRNLALHGFALTLTHNKRDSDFMPTEGHLIEGSIEEVLGSYTYPRATLNLRKYFPMHERPDGSGRHVLSVAANVGYTGDNTPIYEHFYAGGFSSLRGFQFRGASPHVYSPAINDDVFIGGHFQLLTSVEYLFPITADDMLRGVVFCDTGTVEPSINNWSNRYRVAPGFGLRIAVPAMGPAPIALDFAFPVSREPGDRNEVFSFFMGFNR